MKTFIHIVFLGEEFEMYIYNTIKRIARDKSMSIYSIERNIGFSNGTISKWNNSVPSANRLNLVANLLGVTVEDILKKSKGDE